MSIPARPSHAPQRLDALLSMGFRPLYLAGCLWGIVAVALWVYAPQQLTSSLLPGMYWHAHEMLWGFIGTIAVGFLLTASATWTGINPLRGAPLGLLCLVWLVARLGYLHGGPLAFWLAAGSETVFFLAAGTCLMRVVTRGNSLRNVGLPWLLVALAAANVLYLYHAYQGRFDLLQQAFDLGLACMALIVLLIGRRVIPFFAQRAVPGLQIPMLVRTGQCQLLISGLAILAGLLGARPWMGALLGLVGLVSLWQITRWRPLAVLSRPMLWILYLGYAALGAGLLAMAAYLLGLSPDGLARPGWHVHLIGIGGFSILIIGMVTRTSLGHLGYPLQLDRLMLASQWAMVAALVLRLAALWPTAATLPLLHTAALCWSIALGLFLWRFAPLMARPRPDEPAGGIAVNPVRPT